MPKYIIHIIKQNTQTKLGRYRMYIAGEKINSIGNLRDGTGQKM